MVFHRFLDNKIEVILKENHFAKMVAIQCWVKAGALNEKKDQRGMAHVLEHMLFKGTDKFGAGELSRIVEASGGDVNAYTTFDRTVYHLTLSSHKAETGLELLADALFNSKLCEKELEKEKEVILEEIRRSNDNPASLVGRKIFEKVYRGMEAARPIIGRQEDIKGFSRQDLLQFYSDWYTPDNLYIVVVGDFKTNEMYELISKYFGVYKGKVVRQPISFKREPPRSIDVELLKNNFQQPRLELAFIAPELEDPDTVYLDLAAFVLGSGDASRLNRRLRDKDGVVNSVGCSIYSPRFGGVFELSALPTEELYLEAVRGLAREMAKIVVGTRPINDEEVSRAKANLIADRVYQEETVTGQARVLGFGLSTSYGYLFDDLYHLQVERVTALGVQEAVEKWIKIDNPIIVGSLPEKSKITKEDIKKHYLAGVNEVREVFAKGKRRQACSNEPNSLVTLPEITEVVPGVKLIYRQNMHSGMFTMTAAAEGGLRAEEASNAGMYNAIASLLANATSSHSYMELLDIVEGAGATLLGFSGKDSFGLKLQCLSAQAEDLLAVWGKAFLQPVFPEEQWGTIKREIQQVIETEEDSSANMGIKLLQKLIYNEHPYGQPIYGQLSSIASFTCAMLLENYKSARDKGPWIISCVTSLPKKKVLNMLREVLGKWRPKVASRPQFAADLAQINPPACNRHLSKEREQSHILIAYKALAWPDRDRAALDVLSTIMGGSGGRLFSKLREEEGLSYVVTPIISYGCHPGLFGAYVACAPLKTELAIAAITKEFERLCQEEPTAIEVDRAINYIIGSHEADFQRSESQSMTMALMEAYGNGFDDFLTYPDKIKKVSRQDISQVARRLIRDGNRVMVTVGP